MKTMPGSVKQGGDQHTRNACLWETRRGIVMSWLDVIAPLMVIGLLTLLFFFIASSKGFPHDSRYR
jgi:hypothetical protein